MKILVNGNLSENANKTFQAYGFEVLNTKVAQNQLQNFINEEHIDAIIIKNNTQIQQELIDECSSLKLIACTKSNADNIDTQYAIDQGLHIVTPSLSSSQSVAELVFAHLFGMVRFLHQSNREMPLEGDTNFESLQKQFVGTELRGKTLGIIGMNKTGIDTAKIALGIGMKVIFADSEPKSITVPIEFFDGQGLEFNFEAQPLEVVLSSADFITLHTNTENQIITASEIEKMKDNVAIINCCKSGLVDEIALVEAIESGKVKYAALDFFEKEPSPEIQLLMNGNLSLSPNIASNTIEAKQRIDKELTDKIIELLQN